jgi:hypothetical protein
VEAPRLLQRQGFTAPMHEVHGLMQNLQGCSGTATNAFAIY